MGGRLKVHALGIALASWAFGGCGATTPLVPSGPHPPGIPAGERVGFPPPPARVEVLPLQRREACVWRDGHWEWDGQGWRWTAGAWILPPADCYYARPETEWIRVGGSSQLVYRAPRWYPDPDSNVLGRCEEPLACASLLPESRDPQSRSPQRVPTAR